jgi:hypothetical protein
MKNNTQKSNRLPVLGNQKFWGNMIYWFSYRLMVLWLSAVLVMPGVGMPLVFAAGPTSPPPPPIAQFS